jgi:hypothetical protein
MVEFCRVRFINLPEVRVETNRLTITFQKVMKTLGGTPPVSKRAIRSSS